MFRFAAVVALLCASMARAEEMCELQRAAVLDAKVGSDIHLYLPAEIGGFKTRLMLDTGGGWSGMRAGLVKQLGLVPNKLRTTGYADAAGGMITHYVTVPRLTLGGQLVLGESDYLVMTDDSDEGLDTYGGTIGAERLSNYDIEIDNSTKSVMLFRSDKFCSGRLVKWTDKWIEIPYRFNNEIPELRVSIGGERVRAIFDTGSTRTLMDLDVARSVFGVGPGSPGVEPLDERTLPSGKKLQFYKFRVKSLEVSGLVFDDVEVRLGNFDGYPLVLGMHEINQLHLYIASKRKIIYATQAGAKN
jgi:predicted aspartyl protease